MNKKRSAIVVACSMILYIVFQYFRYGLTADASFIGKLLIVGVTMAALVEAIIACWIVLTVEDDKMGELKDYRTGVMIGLVAGLVFAVLTFFKEFGVISIHENTSTQSVQGKINNAQPGSQEGLRE